MLLMLEDNAERVARFTSALESVTPMLRLEIWRDAGKMIRDLPRLLPQARLISLDHDLEPEDGGDPGTGYEVAQYLAALAPVCPVIVHTSNGPRADWMIGAFDLGGWKSRRIAPLGDDWIEKDWIGVVRRLLRRGGTP